MRKIWHKIPKFNLLELYFIIVIALQQSVQLKIMIPIFLRHLPFTHQMLSQEFVVGMRVMMKNFICFSWSQKVKPYYSMFIWFCRNIVWLSFLADGSKICCCQIPDSCVLHPNVLLSNRCRGNHPASIWYQCGADPERVPTCCLVAAPFSWPLNKK